MSYILDALKKSEQERSRGTIPDIKTVHHPRLVDDKKPSHWPYILLAVLLVNAAGLGFWIYQQNRQAGADSSGDVAEAMPELASRDSSPVRQTLSDTPPQSQNPSPQADTKAMSDNVDHAMATSPDNSQFSAKKPKAATPSKPNVIFSDEPLSVSETELKNADTLAESGAVSDVQITPHTASFDTRSAELLNEKIYDIAELPEDVKRALPAISFAGHVYSSVQSQRSVMLNGKKMREGDEVTKELLLQEITVEGVVLQARGYRFRLGALQDWSFQ